MVCISSGVDASFKGESITELGLMDDEMSNELTSFDKVMMMIYFFSISGYLYVLTLFISCFLFKQTFAIPGSVFLNLLAGKIFGLERGLPMVCLLTAIGASFCYYLAKFAGRNAGMR